jgi:hypothetical protein
MMYSLLASQVAFGDGRLGAQVALLIAHRASTTAPPTKGKRKFFSLAFFMTYPFALLTLNDIA